MLWLQFGFSGCKELNKHYIGRSVSIETVLNSCIWKACSICRAKTKSRSSLILGWASWKVIMSLMPADKKVIFLESHDKLLKPSVLKQSKFSSDQMDNCPRWAPLLPNSVALPAVKHVPYNCMREVEHYAIIVGSFYKKKCEICAITNRL